MKGKSEVIAVLSEMLTEELAAINQYMLHAEMQDNWGYPKLGKQTKIRSIREMKHAEMLMERILFLEGMPNMVNTAKIRIGKDIKQQIELDLALEKGVVAGYNKAVETCRKVSDNATADFLIAILKDEEDHVDQLEKQLELIAQLGFENYLVEQMGGAE